MVAIVESGRIEMGRSTTRGRVGSLSSLRELNRLKVLEVVRERGTVSRSQIATATGLARSTVSTLVGELQRAGLVVEREDAQAASAASGGRPPLMLSLDPGAGAVIGIQFDHDFVRVAIADLSFTILAEGGREADVDHDAQAGLETAAELVNTLLAKSGIDNDRLIGAGVALSGPVDRATGQVISATILPGWLGVDVASWLSERLGVRVEVENDANLGALAESVLGAGRDAAEMAYVMLSSGIGGGLILGGRLYRGARGMAGEIGHVSVDESGHMCRCGNRGCLETMVGAAALTDLLRRSHGDDITVERMIALAREGDPGCRRVIADAGHTVGRIAAALCNEFNPERIVVGGELALAGDLLLDPMRESIRRYAIPAAAEGLTVVAGALGDRAELMGALALVVGQSEQVLSGRVVAAAGR
jgi:predicted NBD/HSP70 family sugar kinase/DNA-binding transcriptional ArsR family regulator